MSATTRNEKLIQALRRIETLEERCRVLTVQNAELTAERDAAQHDAELYRDTLVDNETYCMEMMRERDAARADADRLAAALQQIIDTAGDQWLSAPKRDMVAIARDALAEHQRGEG